MKEVVFNDIFSRKKIKKISNKYLELDWKYFTFRIPEVTVHGRFQPPLHADHFYTYVANAFRIAQKVYILITNPDLDEEDVGAASHRNKRENNPFSFAVRKKIFEEFFRNIGIPKSRYEIKPFNITDKKNWAKVLDKDVPNLVNTYGDWSEVKLASFKKKGYKVIHSSYPKLVNASGSEIRKIIFSDMSRSQKKKSLIKAGLMPEAVKPVLDNIKK